MKIDNNKIFSFLKKTIVVLIVFFVSFLIAQSICYFILDDIVFIFFTGLIQYLLLRLFITLTLFVSIGYLFQWGFIHKNIFKIGLIIYTILLLTLTLKPQHERLVNFNVMAMFEGLDVDALAMPLLIGNVLMYIPFGYLINFNFNSSFINKVILSIFFIFSIEVLQFVFKLGVFDINDIILNSIGLIIGLLLFEFYTKIKKKISRSTKSNSL